MRPSMYRLAFALFALLSLSAAALQINDPAPVLWIIIYGVAAALGVAATLKRPPPTLASALFAAACAIFALYKGYLVATGAITPMFEGTAPDEVGLIGSKEGREMLGLWIVALGSAGVAWYRRSLDQ